MHAMGSDRIGRARRSAAVVLSLAVLVGSCGVAASVTATFGVAWSGTVALLVAVPLMAALAVRGWRSALCRPLSGQAGSGRAVAAIGAAQGDTRRARNTVS